MLARVPVHYLIDSNQLHQAWDDAVVSARSYKRHIHGIPHCIIFRQQRLLLDCHGGD